MTKLKFSKIFTAIIVFLVFIIGCNSNQDANDPNFFPTTESMANIALHGMYAYQDGWVYSPRDRDALVRYKLDGSDKEVIYADQLVNNINVVGDWLYLIRNNKIIKVKTNGNNETTIKEDANGVNNMIVAGGWIYYVEQGKPGIQRMKTDGSGVTAISNSAISMFYVMEDAIYYLADTQMYKMNHDGSSQTKVVEGNVAHFTIADNEIYFASMQGGLNKMDLDGSNKQVITNETLMPYFIIDDYVVGSTGMGGLESVKIDGGERKKLIDQVMFHYQLDGDLYAQKSSLGEPDGFGIAVPNNETNLFVKVAVDGSGTTPIF